jgi:hypothetical protein
MEQTGWRKSNRSSDQADSACVEARASSWRKSTRSTGQPDTECVEARSFDSDFQVRDSKLGDTSPVFDLKTADFTSLLRSAARF